MEEQFFIFCGNFPLRQHFQCDDCGSYLGTRHKAGRLHDHVQMGVTVILYRNGQSAIFLIPGACLHPFRYFFLYHNGDGIHFPFIFQQIHNNGCGDVIRQVCHHFDGAVVIFLPNDGVNICFQDILIANFDVVIICQCFRQNGNQVAVDFNGNHFSGVFCQYLCQTADTGTDFQHTVLFCNTGTFCDIVQNVAVNEEVLTEILFEVKTIFLNDLLGSGRC